MRTRLASLAASALVAFSAGIAFAFVFDLGRLVLPVAIAAILPALVVALLARRVPPLLSVLLSLALLVLCGFALMVALKADHPSTALWDGMRNGWRQILTSTIPPPGEPELLMVPFTLTWLAGLSAAELVARTRSCVTALVVPCGVLVTALMFNDTGSGASIVAPAVFVAADLLFLLVRATDLETRSLEAGSREADLETADGTESAIASKGGSDGFALRKIAMGLPVLVVIALLAGALAPRLPLAGVRAPFTLRDHVKEPIDTREELNPLALVRALNTTRPGDVLFQARAFDPELYWRWATLDEFDGKSWSNRGEFVRTGERPPDAPSTNVPTRTVTNDVTVVENPTSLLPLTGYPTKITLDPPTAVEVDPGTGTVAVTGVSVDTGLSYRADTMLPEPTVEQLKAARVPADPDIKRYLELPDDLPIEVSDLATAVVKEANTTFQSAALIERYLGTDGGYSVDAEAPSGQSIALLRYMLFEGKKGTSDQFASAFAVLARVVGLPARVVVGFKPSIDPAGGDQPVDLRGGDAYAWAEVYFQDLGWVAFDAVPGAQGSSKADDQKPQDELQSAKSGAVDDAVTNQQETPRVDPTDTTDLPKAESTATRMARTVAISLLVLLWLAIAIIATIVFLKARRRRTLKTTGTTAERVAGAWRASLDSLGEVGVPDTEAWTAGEVLDAAAERFDEPTRESLTPLAKSVNVALFDDRSDPTADDVDVAWGNADEFRRRLDATQHRFRRWCNRVDPRPLIRSRR